MNTFMKIKASKKYEQAVSCFDQILKPDDPCSYNLEGAALFELKKYKEAIYCFD